MSWEEMYTCSSSCPCGKGKITQTSYGDDWNRIKNGPVVIECEECAKKYKVEEVMYHGLLPSDGSWSIYYLTPKDYPDYEGPKESDLYPAPISQYQNFTVWLIENFTGDELRSVLAQLEKTTSSAKLTGIAAKIREAHKKAKKTVRMGEIKRTVEAALEEYSKHVGNKIQREEIRKNLMHVMLI